MGEVEADMIVCGVGACLLNVIAQYGAERLLQQVGGGVCTADSLAVSRINRSRNLILNGQLALGNDADVHVLAVLGLLHVGNGHSAVLAGDNAVVTDLAAHFSVERRAVEYNGDLLALGSGAGNLALVYDSQDLCRLLKGGVAVKCGLDGLVQTQILALPAEVAHLLAVLTGTLALLVHQAVKLLAAGGHALLLEYLKGQVDREAVGVIQLECIRSGQLLAVGSGDLVIQDSKAAVDGLVEAGFLVLDNLVNIFLLLNQLRICAAGLVDNGGSNIGHKRLVNAEQLAVTNGAAQQAAQNVAAALVGRDNAVADHHNGGADVVGDNAQGNIGLIAVAVVLAGDLGHLVGDVAHGVNVEQRANTLYHARQTLQTHAGVDVLLLQLRVVAVAVVVELGEYVVPYLHVAVTVAADGAAGLAAAVLGAAVVVDLRARAARTGAMLPEVVLLAEAEDTLRCNADLLVPDLECLVIVNVDGRIQAIRVNADPLRTGQEFPAPVNGLALEVVAEGEVAQHLEEGAVTGGLANVLDIAGADALLAGGNAVARRLLLAGEERLHRRHAGVDEQKRRVVLRDERKARQAEMTLGFKETEVHLAQLVESSVLHIN